MFVSFVSMAETSCFVTAGEFFFCLVSSFVLGLLCFMLSFCIFVAYLLRVYSIAVLIY